MRILILNGPNLNLLGTREPEIYGSQTLRDIESKIKNRASTLKIDVTFKQTNHEGEIIDALHRTKGRVQGVILNAGGYTHTSVAIRDAISAIDAPVVEVHLSNLHAREEFRHTSLLAAVCMGHVSGLGAIGYELALVALFDKFQDEEEAQEDRRGRTKTRTRGGRGRGRGRSERRETEAGGRDGERAREDEPREELPSLEERYGHVEGVTVRRGIDALDEDDGDEMDERDGGGSVSFGEADADELDVVPTIAKPSRSEDEEDSKAEIAAAKNESRASERRDASDGEAKPKPAKRRRPTARKKSPAKKKAAKKAVRKPRAAVKKSST